MSATAITGGRIFDGRDWHDDKSLIVAGDRVAAISADVPAGARRIGAEGALIVPGFIDLQVNGGGGVMFNSEPTPEGIARMARAHARFGTTKLLPTLITDTPDITAEARKAGREAIARKIPGFLGIHLEGPHLSVARKGAHDPALIRRMEAADLDALRQYRGETGLLLTTLAPESVSRQQVMALAQVGVTISLGHTDTTCANALDYFEAGARMSTHLFNAMSPLGHREPGLVGATIHSGAAFAGIIADGFHVDPVAMGVALRAKQGPGRIFIVTDAMSTIGTDEAGLLLNGRPVFREHGRLTLADGTLAGADIDMLSSVLYVHRTLGLPLDEVIRMASLYPAEAMGVGDRYGRLMPGYAADFILLDPALSIRSVFIDGVELE
ncbi:MAG: N-acetylglucosamine-6-phosphate deacetylase [Rhizobium sp.]|nr:N-acetylglucosamine-6-phosphate deacetylase [Rhizobium sp.]